jgi:integrase/recombinase XerD
MPPAFKVQVVGAGPVPVQVLSPDGTPADEINEFLDHLAACGRSGYTLRSYGAGLAHFFGWLAERRTPVNDVSRHVVGAYIAAFSSGPKADPCVGTAGSNHCAASGRERADGARRQPRTINHRMSLLASYFAYRIQKDQECGGGAWSQRDNPAAATAAGPNRCHRQPGRDLPIRRRRTGDFRWPVPRTFPKQLYPDSTELLIQAARSWRDKAILTLLARAGQRIGDWSDIAGRHGILGMTLGDFDRQRGMIVVLLKGSRDEHRVPVADDFWPVFDRYLAEERQVIAPTPAAWLGLRRGSGEPLSCAAFESSLRYNARKIGLKVHAHMFRHTLAQGVLDTTGNLKVAQEILGHAHVSTTADLYMHVDFSAMVDALAAVKVASAMERRSRGNVAMAAPERYAFPYDDVTLEELEKAATQPREQTGADHIDNRETGNRKRD